MSRRSAASNASAAASVIRSRESPFARVKRLDVAVHGLFATQRVLSQRVRLPETAHALSTPPRDRREDIRGLSSTARLAARVRRTKELGLSHALTRDTRMRRARAPLESRRAPPAIPSNGNSPLRQSGSSECLVGTPLPEPPPTGGLESSDRSRLRATRSIAPEGSSASIRFARPSSPNAISPVPQPKIKDSPGPRRHELLENVEQLGWICAVACGTRERLRRPRTGCRTADQDVPVWESLADERASRAQCGLLKAERAARPSRGRRSLRGGR